MIMPSHPPCFRILRIVLTAICLSGGFSAVANPEAAALIARGDGLDARMKTAEALSVYLEAEALAPDNPRLLNQIAKQYGESMVDLSDENERKAAGQQALAYALKSVNVAPENAESHLALAICYGRLLDLVSSREKVEYSRLVKTHTEKAIQLDPSLDYAWHMLGRWHRAVVDAGPLLRGIVTVVYGGLPKASLDDAATAFEKAAALNPTRVAHQIEMGITYALMGRSDDARQAIQRGLTLPAKERDDPDTQARGRAVLDSLRQ